MIQLYSLPVSSYSAKVRIVLRAKHADFDDVLPLGGHSGPDYAHLVPAATVPAIDHDGFVLWESEAINEYLDEVFPEPAMLPADPKARGFARAFSRFHDTRLEPALRALFSQIAPSGRDSAAVEKGAALITLRLRQLSAILARAPFAAGERLLLSDCGFAVAFVVLETLSESIGFAAPMPQDVAAYRDRIWRHGPVADELSDYRGAIGDWIGARLSGS